MIELTQAKATLFEFMKTGQYTYKEIVKGTGIPYDTVRTFMRQFRANNMVEAHGNRQYSTFTTLECEYVVVTSKFSPDKYTPCP